MSVLDEARTPGSAVSKWLHSPGSMLPLHHEALLWLLQTPPLNLAQLASVYMAEAGVLSFAMKTPPLLQLLWYGCGCPECLDKAGVEEGAEPRTLWMSEEVVSFLILIASTNIMTRSGAKKPSVSSKLMPGAIGAVTAMQHDCVRQMQMQDDDKFAVLRDALGSDTPDLKQLVSWVRAQNMCGRDASRITLSQIGALENLVWHMALANLVDEGQPGRALVDARNIYSTPDLVVPLAAWDKASAFVDDWYRQAYKALFNICCGVPERGNQKKAKTRKFVDRDLWMPRRISLWTVADEAVSPDDAIHPATALLALIAMYRLSFLGAAKKETADL